MSASRKKLEKQSCCRLGTKFISVIKNHFQDEIQKAAIRLDRLKCKFSVILERLIFFFSFSAASSALLETGIFDSFD